MTYNYDRRQRLGNADASLRGTRFFHGTSSKFETFDLTKAGARDHGDFGVGVYLTPSSRLATRYAYESAKQTRGEPQVLAVRVHVRKTVDFDDADLQAQIRLALDIPFPNKTLTSEGRQTRPRSEALAITQYVRALGYDSGLARNGNELIVYDAHTIEIEAVYPAAEASYLL